MKVLHLPNNVASQMSVLVRALREHGVDARGLTLNNSASCDPSGLEEYLVPPPWRNPVGSAIGFRAWSHVLREALTWADVVHWHFGAPTLPFGNDLKLAAAIDTPRIVQFWGSDIRIPEVASADNPFAKRMYDDDPSVTRRGRKDPRKVQALFAKYGFACLLPTQELASYLHADLFPRSFQSRTALLLEEFSPKFPDPGDRRPLVIHAPSSPRKKGTDAVLHSVRQLKDENTPFDFQLLTGMPRSEVLATVRECGVFLDQFTLGDHGLATLEAFALGKPVVCYIKPSLVDTFPSDFPVINANQDRLTDVLRDVLRDGERRNRCGRQGRAYVEKYHQARNVARELIDIYEQLLAHSAGNMAQCELVSI